MRLFHSLWTKPALDKRWDTSNQLESNIWLYTLSVIFAKKQGFEIVLHTDTLGKKLLGHLPYNQIYTTLDKIPSSIPTMIWAYGKFVALKEEPLGSIHIDGDVMITTSKCADSLKGDYDLIIQNKEPSYSYILDKLAPYGFTSKGFFTTSYAYNCGIVGFNNSTLKQSYLDFYFKETTAVAKNNILKKQMTEDKHLCVDLPLEQWSLSVLSEKNYKVKSLLEGDIDYDWWRGNSQINKNAQNIGYLHLIGKSKYSAIDKVKFYVLALDKDLYYKTKEIIEKYKNILS